MNHIKHMLLSLILALSICACTNNASESSGVNSKEEPIDRYPLITDEIKEIADSYKYDFDPTSLLIKEKENYDFNNKELSDIPFVDVRENHHLVYVFDNQYAIGYSGIYDRLYSKIYLWDDGLYCGKINATTIKGYWYNCSLNAIEEQKDCLNMVSNVSHYEKIECSPADDYYDYKAYVDMLYQNRYMEIEMYGYLYYPEVAIIIDDNGRDTYRVGTYFYADETTDVNIKTTWTVLKVAKNLTYTYIIPDNEISWDIPEGLVNDKYKLEKTGEYVLVAHWKNFVASKTLKVIM